MQQNSKKAIITFADNNLNFLKGAKKIEKELIRQKFDGDFFLFTEIPKGCPTHEKSSYGFKAFCIKEVFLNGYNHILYLDSSTKIVGPIQTIFDVIATDGYYLHCNNYDNGTIGMFCTDEVLEKYNVTRDEVMDIKYHVGSFCGLNMNLNICKEFLEEFLERAVDGSFYKAGGNYDKMWEIHRQDDRQKGHRQQSVTSLIALKLGMKIETRYASVRPWEFEQFEQFFISKDTILWSDRHFVKKLKKKYFLM